MQGSLALAWNAVQCPESNHVPSPEAITGEFDLFDFGPWAQGPRSVTYVNMGPGPMGPMGPHGPPWAPMGPLGPPWAPWAPSRKTIFQISDIFLIFADSPSPLKTINQMPKTHSQCSKTISGNFPKKSGSDPVSIPPTSPPDIRAPAHRAKPVRSSARGYVLVRIFFFSGKKVDP